MCVKRTIRAFLGQSGGVKRYQDRNVCRRVSERRQKGVSRAENRVRSRESNREHWGGRKGATREQGGVDKVE